MFNFFEGWRTERYKMYEMYVQCMQDNYNNLFRDDDQREGVEGETYRTFELDLRRNVTATIFSIIASQPLYVVTVRTMAQFVEQEEM